MQIGGSGAEWQTSVRFAGIAVTCRASLRSTSYRTRAIWLAGARREILLMPDSWHLRSCGQPESRRCLLLGAVAGRQPTPLTSPAEHTALLGAVVRMMPGERAFARWAGRPLAGPLLHGDAPGKRLPGN